MFSAEFFFLHLITFAKKQNLFAIFCESFCSLKTLLRTIELFLPLIWSISCTVYHVQYIMYSISCTVHKNFLKKNSSCEKAQRPFKIRDLYKEVYFWQVEVQCGNFSGVWNENQNLSGLGNRTQKLYGLRNGNPIFSGLLFNFNNLF